MPHLHLWDNAAKSGKPGHNRDIVPKIGTVPAKPGHLATMHSHCYYTVSMCTFQDIFAMMMGVIYVNMPEILCEVSSLLPPLNFLKLRL